MTGEQILIGVSAIAVEGRAIMIDAPPRSGKSSLALSLIDRGAKLIGDDGVVMKHADGKILLFPPPNLSGKIEIDGVGIVEMETASAPLSLILSLQSDVPRYPDTVGKRDLLGLHIPQLPFCVENPNPALRAEWALRTHGLTF